MLVARKTVPSVGADLAHRQSSLCARCESISSVFHIHEIADNLLNEMSACMCAMQSATPYALAKRFINAISRRTFYRRSLRSAVCEHRIKDSRGRSREAGEKADLKERRRKRNTNQKLRTNICMRFHHSMSTEALQLLIRLEND